MMNVKIWTLATLALATLAASARTFDVDVSTGRPAASNEAYYHGETIEFRAVRGETAVTDIEYGCVYYQTNGMGEAWWHTDGLVFHPTNDVGAASYRFFLEGRDALGRDWHANGLLRLLDSPGFTPSAVELPVKTLDFSRIDVLNAPYYTKAEVDAAVSSAAPGDYANVSNKAYSAVQPGDVPGIVSNTVTKTFVEDLGISGGGGSADDFIANVSGDARVPAVDADNFWYLRPESAGSTVRTYGLWKDWIADIASSSAAGNYPAVSNAAMKAATPRAVTNIVEALAYKKAAGATAGNLPAFGTDGNIVDSGKKPADFASAAAVSTAATSATNYTDQVNKATRAIVYSWEAYIGGSNVVHSITNYISGDYPLDDGKYKIYELRDGTYRELYNSHTDITNHFHALKASEIDPALTRMENTVNDALDGKADKEWGKYTSAGERNEMTNTVWITHPETVFGGGTEWRRVAVGEGSVAFLVNSKQQIHTAGEEGKFYFSDWGYTNKFGFATTASYTIGIDPDSIHVEGATGIVSVGFDVTMDGMPVIWYCNDLTHGAWEQLNTTDGSPTAGASHVVSFDSTSTPGWIYAFINCANDPQGFFRATVEHAGGASFFTSMPADFQGGIMCTDSVHKVSIDWNGGAPRLVPFAGE